MNTKKMIFSLLLALVFMPNAAMSVGRNHPDRFKGNVTLGKAKKPYAYCNKGWAVRIVGPITEVNDKLAYSAKKVTFECSKTTFKLGKTSAKCPRCPPLTSTRGKEMNRGRDICAAPPRLPPISEHRLSDVTNMISATKPETAAAIDVNGKMDNGEWSCENQAIEV